MWVQLCQRVQGLLLNDVTLLEIGRVVPAGFSDLNGAEDVDQILLSYVFAAVRNYFLT